MISLEGKSFWVIKTMPIDSRAVLIGKALLNMMLVVPVVIVASCLLWLVLKLEVLEFLMLLCLPIFVNIFISFIGVFINLLYPKFDFESEHAVVKRSMATLITTFVGLGTGMIPVLALVFIGLNNMLLVAAVCAGALGSLAAGAVVLTLTKGKEIYEKL